MSVREKRIKEGLDTAFFALQEASAALIKADCQHLAKSSDCLIKRIVKMKSAMIFQGLEIPQTTVTEEEKLKWVQASLWHIKQAIGTLTNKTVTTTEDAMLALIEIDNLPRWISVTERLPSQSGMYVGCSTDDKRSLPTNTTNALYNFNAEAEKGQSRWQHSSGFYDNAVTHWLEFGDEKYEHMR